MIGKAIDGIRGTVVFGNGTCALVGEIAHTGSDDYLVVTGKVAGSGRSERDIYIVPLTAIAYVRIDERSTYTADDTPFVAPRMEQKK